MYDWGMPATLADTSCDNYMRAKSWYGSHLKASDTLCANFTSGRDVNYAFTGDPSNPSKQSECACNLFPNDAKFVLATSDFTFNSGDINKVVFAQIVADSTGGCPATSFDKIKIVADTAWFNYFNPPPPKPAGITPLANNTYLKVYPNPANDKLYVVNTAANSAETITVYNTLGQPMDLPILKNGQKIVIDVSSLSSGLYYLQYKSRDQQATTKFVKE